MLQVQRHQNLEPPDLEVICCTVKTHAGNLLVGAVFHPGSLPGTDSRLIDYLSDNLDSVIQTTGSDRVMIRGDFDVHHQEWLGSKSN